MIQPRQKVEGSARPKAFAQVDQFFQSYKSASRGLESQISGENIPRIDRLRLELSTVD